MLFKLKLIPMSGNHNCSGLILASKITWKWTQTYIRWSKWAAEQNQRMLSINISLCIVVYLVRSF